MDWLEFIKIISFSENLENSWIHLFSSFFSLQEKRKQLDATAYSDVSNYLYLE